MGEVSDFNQKLFSIYPNPAENILTVATDFQVETIKIYSLFGQLVIDNANTNTIDVSRLTQGFYLAEIKLNNGQTISKKIVKK